MVRGILDLLPEMVKAISDKHQASIAAILGGITDAEDGVLLIIPDLETRITILRHLVRAFHEAGLQPLAIPLHLKLRELNHIAYGLDL